MNSGRLTIILLALAVVPVVAVPSVRGGIDTLFVEGVLGYPDRLPSPAEVERIVEQHPDNAQLALGRAEYLAGLRAAHARVSSDMEWGAWADLWTRIARALPPSIPSEEDVSRAYELTVARAGEETSAFARYALWSLPPFMTPIHIPSDPSEAPPSLDPAERIRIEAARPHLRRWFREDPRNGTPVIMSAWTLVAQARMDPAIEELKRLEHVDRWQTYNGVARSTAAALVAESGRTVRSDYFFIAEPGADSRARNLARALANSAHTLREAGRHRPAVVRYVATLRIGMLLAASPQGMDFLTAGSVFAHAISHDAAPFPSDPTREDIAAHQREAMEGLARYLRRHNAGGTAEKALATQQEWHDRRRQLTAAMDADRVKQWRIAGSPPLSNIRIIWWTLAALTGLTALCGVVALLLRPREARRRLRWRWREWLALVALLIIPLQLWFAFIAEPPLPPDVREPGGVQKVAKLLGDGLPIIPLPLQWEADLWLPPAALAVGLWAVISTGIAVRRRQSDDGHALAARMALRDLLRLAVPTLALMVLLSVIAVSSVYIAGQDRARDQIERQMQGDLVYFGIMDAEEDGGEAGWP